MKQTRNKTTIASALVLGVLSLGMFSGSTRLVDAHNTVCPDSGKPVVEGMYNLKPQEDGTAIIMHSCGCGCGG